MNYPFMDRNGEVVLWDRRKIEGRRSSDVLAHWNSRRDLPGLLVILILFVVLTLGIVSLWVYKDLLLGYLGS